MHTQEIHVAGAHEAVSAIRCELFAFPEVIDVLGTSRSDLLVVVVFGRPRPAEWTRHLQAAGYEVLRPQAASSSPGPDVRPARAQWGRGPAVGGLDAVAGPRPGAARRRRSRAGGGVRSLRASAS